MNLSKFFLPALVVAALLMPSTPASAQSATGSARSHVPTPSSVTRTLTPPRPAGLGGHLPPGHGGPHPGATRRATSSAHGEAVGLAAVCGPGGALSAQAAADNPGRTRARALVCPN